MTADDVAASIMALDAQASRCFLAADKLHQRDLPKAKRLVALGFQAAEQSSVKRKIWNDLHSGRSAAAEGDVKRAQLEAFADRAIAANYRPIDPMKIARMNWSQP